MVPRGLHRITVASSVLAGSDLCNEAHVAGVTADASFIGLAHFGRLVYS